MEFLTCDGFSQITSHMNQMQTQVLPYLPCEFTCSRPGWLVLQTGPIYYLSQYDYTASYLVNSPAVDRGFIVLQTRPIYSQSIWLHSQLPCKFTCRRPKCFSLTNRTHLLSQSIWLHSHLPSIPTNKIALKMSNRQYFKILSQPWPFWLYFSEWIKEE